MSATTITYHCGDVRDVMADMADNSVHFVVTSPPFLALRSYLPADHPDKHREIGSETTPAAFIDTMLGLTADWRRLLPSWGSIAVEIGDTYSGSGGAGGDYNDGGLRDGQSKFDGAGKRNRGGQNGRASMVERATGGHHMGGVGWPQAKSLTGVPTLYAWSLAYGRNLLTGEPSPAGQWRIRNLLTWTRPNPPVGALGDKFRPATSFVTVACTSGQRWFDLDAVRTPLLHPDKKATAGYREDGSRRIASVTYDAATDSSGAPPLDWWDANDEAADWQPLHRLPTHPYSGSHYATFPVALPQRLILAMCPAEVCTECGEPRRRITKISFAANRSTNGPQSIERKHLEGGSAGFDVRADRMSTTLGWTDCGHTTYTTGVVLDPFGGSGTTAVAAARAGRDAILIDIDARNVELARQRIGEQLRIVNEHQDGDTTTWTVEAPLPNQRGQVEGQRNIFEELAG